MSEQPYGLRQQLAENPPALRVIAIIAIVFGVLGTGAGLFNLVMHALGGGFLATGAGGLGAASGGEQIMQGVQLAVGILRGALGGLLSLLVVATGIAALGRRPRPLGILSAVCLVYIVLMDIIVPTALSIANALVMSSGMRSLGQDATLIVGTIVGVVAATFTCTVLWSALRLVFWGFAWSTVRRTIAEGPWEDGFEELT